jgi:hypothetical protein
MALLSVVAVIAACCALVASGGAASAGTAAITAPAVPGATGTWGDAETVSGLPSPPPYVGGISALSCAAAGDCSAAGFYGYDDQGSTAYLVDETGGSWGNLLVIPGTASYWSTGVNSLSCASPGNCSAGGAVSTYTSYNSPPFTQAFVVNETDGTWGTAEIVPGTSALNVGDSANVSSISCTAVGDCAAGGSYDTAPWDAHTGADYEAFVADETNGVWGAAHSVPRPSGAANTVVNSVSCASPGNCAAAGSDYTHATENNAPPTLGQAFVLDQTGGVWGSAREVPGTAGLNIGDDASAESVSCTAVGDCTLGGYYDIGKPDSATLDLQAFVADETGGTWGAAREVPGTAALNAGGNAQATSVSCASPGNCAVGGTYTGSSHVGRAFIVNQTNGTWGKAEEVPGTAPAVAKDDSQVTSVSCASAGNCSAAGYEDGAPNSYSYDAGTAFVVDETGGVWGAARQIPGMAALNSGGPSAVASVSCVSAADCAVGGAYGYTSAAYPYVNPFIVEKSVHTATATATALSAAKVAYGDERAERFSVKVTAGSAGTPTGRVIIASGATTVCKFTLASGAGSCTSAADRPLPAGSVKVTAVYRGSFAFGVSASTGSFTVVKDPVNIGLILSATTVTYGHEQAEKLSVVVFPRYAGTPGGRVTVKADRTTVCVITLKPRTVVACTLAAKQLRPGTYTLTAVYPGSADYASVTSPGKTLTVAK